MERQTCRPENIEELACTGLAGGARVLVLRVVGKGSERPMAARLADKPPPAGNPPTRHAAFGSCLQANN